MANDMRLSLDFVDHPKVRKLVRRVGYEGFFSLMKLFSMAGKIYPKGVLKDLEIEDIEDLCEWSECDGKFVESLLEVGFLKKEGGAYAIHDWKEHQPWIYHADARSERAKNAAARRWDAGRIQVASKSHTTSNAPSPIPTPSPTPNPSNLPSDSAIRLATLLLEKSRVHDPKIAIGKDERTIASWSKDIDRLLRLDKRTEEEVESVIRWCKSEGNFWIPNILSGKKLREKFPTLYAQMTARNGNRKQKPLSRHATESGSIATSPDDYDGVVEGGVL